MIRLLILFIFGPLYLFSQENHIDDTSLNKWFRKDSELLFLTIERSTTLKKYFPEKMFGKYYNKEQHSFNFKGTQTKASLIKQIKCFYHKAGDKNIINSTLNRWFSNDSLLNRLSANNIPAEEILFENKLTKILFENYIDPKTQTWSSLSSWQSYELYIDFMNWTENIQRKDLENLFLSLRKTAKTIKTE